MKTPAEANGRNGANGAAPFPWTGVRKLLVYGVGVKRWLLLGAIGIAVFSLGLGYLLVRVFSIRQKQYFYIETAL